MVIDIKVEIVETFFTPSLKIPSVMLIYTYIYIYEFYKPYLHYANAPKTRFMLRDTKIKKKNFKNFHHKVNFPRK